jgi:hypothetical protein
MSTKAILVKCVHCGKHQHNNKHDRCFACNEKKEALRALRRQPSCTTGVSRRS